MRRDAHQNGKMGLGQSRSSFWRRNKWLLSATGGVVLLLAIAAMIVTVLAHRAEPFARALIVQALSERFHARVELDSFRLSLGNSLRGEWGVWGHGRGLRIWPPAAVEGVQVPSPNPPVKPLIDLAEFRFHAPLYYRSGEPVHLSQVRLKGLQIRIPPRSRLQHPGNPIDPPTGPLEIPHAPGSPFGVTFTVHQLECNEAQVLLGTDRPDKLPLSFVIAHFKVTGLAPGKPMNFDAELTNPKPPGVIHSTGSFGPWNLADPGESRLQGTYTFNHADLSVFKGIAGILNSTGYYEGTLRNIIVDGQTDTPDFQLSRYGNPMPLRTNFHARVDGTNGDTWLEPVEGTIGGSHFTTHGQIVRSLAKGNDGRLHTVGHDIALSVFVGQAQIQDFLRLASSTGTPLLTGDIVVNASLHIPPGPAPVHERLTLKGDFKLDQAQFTNPSIQNRIKELSMRGQGRPEDRKSVNPADIKSNMEGEFQIGGGLVKIPSITYTVPGANIQMHGTYYEQNSGLDFTGTAKLHATVSQMVGGWKGMLLKPADRLFKKDGAGTEVPIYISGTRQKPEFGFNLERLPHTHPQRPDTTNN
jgi:hypothetical protein